MPSNEKQLNTMIMSFKLKKDQLSGQMGQLAFAIDQKKQSIAKFELYRQDYQKKIDAETTHTITTYVNHQHFLGRITESLESEKQSLLPMEDLEQKLLVQYHEYSQKLDGLNDSLSVLKQEKQRISDNRLDSELSDLATARAAYDRDRSA